MVSAPAQWRVIITRPQAQADEWAQQLQRQGFATESISLLEISPVQLPEQIQAVKNNIMDLDLYHKVIFVSQNAVRYGMEWIENYWPQLPIGVDFFAVGATTAKILMEYDVSVQDLAASEQGGMTSEDLLCAPQLQQVSGEKILIMRGCGGRGHLADTLRGRGAQVNYCELYIRQLPSTALSQWQALFADAQQWQQQRNIIAVHSGESLDNLLSLCEEPSLSPVRALVMKTPLLVPSDRVAQAAKQAGFTCCVIAQNATDVAMTSALLDYSRTECAQK